MKNQRRHASSANNRRRSLLTACLLMASLGGSVAAFAHHSFAMYDGTRSMELRGTIKEYRFGNPHTLIVITAKDTSGVETDYTIETNGAFYLTRNQGWTRDSLKVGDSVVALIRPLRDGTPGGDLLKVTVSDGRELIARPPPWPPEDKK